MAENVIISNSKSLEAFKEAVKKEGPGSLHVVADFDRTLTTAFIDGKKVPSQISILRDGSYLTSDYATRAHALADKYRPIELNPKISLEEKKKAMHEWWASHFKLLIESGLNRKDIESVVKSGKIRFRHGLEELLDFLHAHNIPLLILSSCGLGTEAIRMQLEKIGRAYENIKIVSNTYEWDENGKALAVKEPIIHTLNKEEASIRHYPAFEAIKDRKNVLLLGDSLSDVGMVKGFAYEHLLKVGFLNEDVEKNLEYYKNAFDVILTNDAPMNYVNEIIRGVVK